MSGVPYPGMNYSTFLPFKFLLSQFYRKQEVFLCFPLARHLQAPDELMCVWYTKYRMFSGSKY